MNSGPVLYLIYLIFCKKEKKVFIVVKKILAFGGTRERALGIVCPDMLANNGMQWFKKSI